MGFDLHMRNLQWAFSNFEHRIFLQTFSGYGFEERENLSITAYHADPKCYFPFYEKLKIDHGDVVVLVQQDNLFSQKADATVAFCTLGQIVTWDQSPYFSIYDQQGQIVYPRIAEISTFMQRELVEEMRLLDLSYGASGRQFNLTGQLYEEFVPKLQNFKICSKPWLPPPACFEVLSDFCHRKVKDTMFDISMYSFCTGKTVRLLNPAAMAHMNNPEMFHREFPDHYRSADQLLHLDVPGRPNVRKNIPNVALMCLLAGVYERDRFVAKALKRGDSTFKFGLAELYTNAVEWMSSEQFDRLNWAVDQVELGSRAPATNVLGESGSHTYPVSEQQNRQPLIPGAGSSTTCEPIGETVHNLGDRP